jgi:hypothetical protein
MRATNQFLEAIPQIKARPVDDNADPDCAKALTEVMRHIHQSSNAEMCYGMAVEPQIREGIGYCRVMTEYAGDGTFDQEIKIKPIPNPYSVYFDPTSILPNGSDARACLICEDMSREEFERQYGKDVETGSFAFIGAGDQRGWNEKNTVRVAEYY